MNRHAFTGRLFYTLVAFWVVAVVAGAIFRLPYVARAYGGVTLPIYSGLVVGALAVCNLASGAIWRGRARPIERSREPTAYWISIAVLAGVSALLSVVGIRNWLQVI